MSIVYLFPGQGSQTLGMGREVFDSYDEYIQKADDILGYSLKTLCLEDPDSRLNLTQYTQPALFIINSLLYLQKTEETQKEPDFAAGHSLGEYTALFAAGAFDFETGVRLVQKRGELMAEAAGGGMAAVIGLGADAVRDVLGSSGIDTIDVANFNSPSQIIVSGPKEDLENVQPNFEQAGARRYIPLKVSAAFHSRYMSDAGTKFSTFLDSISFKDPSIPVISNITALPYEKGQISRNLAQQMTSSVRWQETIEYLLKQPSPEFTEIGPGTVLTKLTQQIAGAK